MTSLGPENGKLLVRTGKGASLLRSVSVGLTCSYMRRPAVAPSPSPNAVKPRRQRPEASPVSAEAPAVATAKEYVSRSFPELVIVTGLTDSVVACIVTRPKS